jgi:hypothetical protein
MHEVWHIVVLAAALFGAAGAAILLLAPLVFEVPPSGLRRFRPALLTGIGMAAVLIVMEWTVVH